MCIRDRNLLRPQHRALKRKDLNGHVGCCQQDLLFVLYAIHVFLNRRSGNHQEGLLEPGDQRLFCSKRHGIVQLVLFGLAAMYARCVAANIGLIHLNGTGQAVAVREPSASRPHCLRTGGRPEGSAGICPFGDDTTCGARIPPGVRIRPPMLAQAPLPFHPPCAPPRRQPGGGPRAQPLYFSRRNRLLILPTLVLSMASTRSTLSGTPYFEITPLSAYPLTKVRIASASAGASSWTPALRTTSAMGRSPHFSSATPITATSLTEGCWLTMSSSSSEEIHSPPVLMTSLIRSEICTYPSSSMLATSPVWRYSPAQSATELRASLR